jgi:hypothetical protein
MYIFPFHTAVFQPTWHLHVSINAILMYTMAQQIVYFCLSEYISSLLRRKLQVKILGWAEDFADFVMVFTH